VPACHACKSVPVQVTHCFTAATTASLLGKCCPHSPPFISPGDESQKGPNPNYTADVVGLSRQDFQLHGLQTDIRPGIIMLQEKGSLLLWPDSGSLSLQLSQCHNTAIRGDGLSKFQQIQKDRPFPIPKERTSLQFFPHGKIQ